MQPINDLGNTKLGLWPSLARSTESDEHWQYVPRHPALNIQLDPIAKTGEGEDAYEGIMVKNEDDGWVQPLFKIYTDAKEMTLGDLFVKHPRHPKLLKHAGRVDEMLNFMSEKFHPVAAEGKIATYPGVEEVIMAGTRQSKGALIVRLKEGVKVDDVWEAVEKVNEEMSVYARVEKVMTLVVDEPFLQTSKGPIR